MNTNSASPTVPGVRVGIAVTTAIRAGARDEGYESQQHAEGIVVTTSIQAGAHDEGYQSQQHAEGIVSAPR